MIFFTVCMRVRMRQGKDLLVMVFLCLALSALLTGCAERIVVSAIGPDGTLAILKPDGQFSRALAKGQWVIVGDPSPGALVITKQDGIPALKFTHSSDDFFLVRPIEANLMATPYLDWSWRMSAHEGPYHSVSLMIGMASTGRLAPCLHAISGTMDQGYHGGQQDIVHSLVEVRPRAGISRPPSGLFIQRYNLFSPRRNRECRVVVARKS